MAACPSESPPSFAGTARGSMDMRPRSFEGTGKPLGQDAVHQTTATEHHMRLAKACGGPADPFRQGQRSTCHETAPRPHAPADPFQKPGEKGPEIEDTTGYAGTPRAGRSGPGQGLRVPWPPGPRNSAAQHTPSNAGRGVEQPAHAGRYRPLCPGRYEGRESGGPIDPGKEFTRIGTAAQHRQSRNAQCARVRGRRRSPPGIGRGKRCPSLHHCASLQLDQLATPRTSALAVAMPVEHHPKKQAGQTMFGATAAR